MIGVCVQGVAYVPPRLQAGFGAPTNVIVNDPGVMREIVRLAPKVAGSKVAPVSVKYGNSVIPVIVGSVEVAVITKRCLAIRYSRVPPKVMLTGTEAVTMMLTVVAGEVPFAFVAATLKV